MRPGSAPASASASAVRPCRRGSRAEGAAHRLHRPAGGVEVGVAVVHVGFEVAALRPLVPGVDDHHLPAGRAGASGTIERRPQPGLVLVGRRTDHAPRAAVRTPRRGVPVGDDARVAHPRWVLATQRRAGDVAVVAQPVELVPERQRRRLQLGMVVEPVGVELGGGVAAVFGGVELGSVGLEAHHVGRGHAGAPRTPRPARSACAARRGGSGCGRWRTPGGRRVGGSWGGRRRRRGTRRAPGRRRRCSAAR